MKKIAWPLGWSARFSEFMPSRETKSKIKTEIKSGGSRLRIERGNRRGSARFHDFFEFIPCFILLGNRKSMTTSQALNRGGGAHMQPSGNPVIHLSVGVLSFRLTFCMPVMKPGIPRPAMPSSTAMKPMEPSPCKAAAMSMPEEPWCSGPGTKLSSSPDSEPTPARSPAWASTATWTATPSPMPTATASPTRMRRLLPAWIPLIPFPVRSLTRPARSRFCHILLFLRRRALVTTEMELMAMAAPAIIGLRRTPKNG